MKTPVTRSAASVIRGDVIHHRLRPAEHRLDYPVFLIRFPLSRMSDLPASGLPVNRFGWVTFDERDHG
ncbi:MAG: DUF1365 family protein, partial [Betaproteobacteria bacterium]